MIEVLQLGIYSKVVCGWNVHAYVLMPGQKLNPIVMFQRVCVVLSFVDHFTIHQFNFNIYMLLQQGCSRINASSGILKHNGTGQMPKACEKGRTDVAMRAW